MPSSLYACDVFHRRYEPVQHGFTTRMFMFLLDLDELPRLVDRIPILSHNRPNIYQFRDDDHLYLGHPTLRGNVEAYLQQQGIQQHPCSIQLLTNLRTFGYVFNPVSFYFCADRNAEVFAIVVEVHNTFGELKPFVLGPEDLQRNGFSRSVDKLFYISPFSHPDNELDIRAQVPAERLAIYVNDRHRGQQRPFFRSSLTGKRIDLTTGNLVRYSLRFPLVTLKVITLIHWHALILYLKRVPFFRKSDHAEMQTGILPKKHQIHGK